MSISLMTAAFKTRIPPTHKFVFVALCDNANDQGECYPSVSMLSEKTSLSERAVQGSIAYLVANGFVRRDMRKGRSTNYFIAPAHLWITIETPAPRAPRTTCTPQEVHPTPADCAPPPPQIVHPTPAPRAPITINEPSIESSGNHQRRKKPAPDLPDWLPMDAWDGYIEMRKEKKKVPTDLAIKLVLDELLKLKTEGQDVKAVLNKSTRNGWTDVYAIKDGGNNAKGASQLGRAGQVTAAAAQRLIERMENEQTG